MRLEVEKSIREALRAAVLGTDRLPAVDPSAIRLEKPREGVHGDLATNVALVLASEARIPARKFAEEIVRGVELPAELVSGIDVAGPGFINLRLSDTFLHRETETIVREGLEYGREKQRLGRRVQLEFVSANPTGPLNVVSARAAAIGDALARILDWAGWDAEAEFYVNDGGTQVGLFAASVRARFLELGGFPSTFPEDGYRGSWVVGIARLVWRLLEAVFETARGDRPLGPWLGVFDRLGPAGRDPLERRWQDASPAERAELLAGASAECARGRAGARSLAEWWLDEEGGISALRKERALALDAEVLATGERWAEAFPFGPVSVALMVCWQRESLHRFGVDFGAETGEATEPSGWFHESRLYERGLVDETLGTLGLKTDAVYEREGAQWLATSRFGDDEDRVLVRRDGRPTYFLTDIAYHRDKLARGYDRVIDIWGPDHHGHIARMKAAMRIVGAGPEWLEVLIGQQVNVLREGRPIKMSKRGGEIIDLDELLEEAGRDTSRFFFLMRRTSSHLDFDLDLARKTSEENPVYYVQYAFARISSIYEFVRQRELSPDGPADFSRLTSPEEVRLMRDLVRFPGEVRAAAAVLEPHRLTVYLQEVAQSFHKFYQERRVVVDDEALARARLGLVKATRIILEGGMHLVGVRPPRERM